MRKKFIKKQVVHWGIGSVLGGGNKGAGIKMKGECRRRKAAFEKLGIGNKAEEILVPGQLCILRLS